MIVDVGGGVRRLVGAMTVAVAVLGTTATLSGCVAASDPNRPVDEKTAPEPSDTLPAGECPRGRNPGNLDYANYVVYGGRMYYSRSMVVVAPDRLGREVGRVRCSIEANNSNYWFVPRDLDAAFLPVDAPLREIVGVPLEQQIAGRWEDGRWLVFAVEGYETVGPSSPVTEPSGR